MNLKQLEYFAKIAETKNYSVAAHHFGVTQSCLSHSVQRLEDELECELFYQNGRSVELTPDGRQLLPFITEALNLVENGITKLRHTSEANHKILINGYSSLSPYITNLIVGFASSATEFENKPQIQYSYEEHLDRLLELLLTEQADFVFSDRIEASTVHSVNVGSRKYVALMPKTHRLAKRKQLFFDDLRDEKIITFPNDCYPGTVVRSCFERSNFDCFISSEATQNPIFYSMIQSGYGLAILPEPLSEKPYGIESISLSTLIPDQQIFIHWKYNRTLTEPQEHFLKYILLNNTGLQ